MTIKKKQNKGGVTRSQLTLIGVLAAVLVGVIVVQLPDSQTVQTVAASTNNNSSEPIAETVGTLATQDQEKPVHREWPQFSSEQFIRFDPLSTPDWYNSILEVVEQNEKSNVVLETAHDLELQEMQEKGTDIVLIAGSERIAKIGETNVRVGDRIDGYEVSNITSEGVILTKSKSR